MGSDEKGMEILYNRSADPVPDAGKLKIIRTEPNKYATGVNGYVISPIKSPLIEKFNKTLFKNGLPDLKLDLDVIRKNDTAENAMFHLSSNYLHPDGTEGFGGAYGCYGIVDPLQVYKDTYSQIMKPESTTSNNEMKKFGLAVDTAKEMNAKDHPEDKDSTIEVEIQTRDYEKIQTKRTK